MSVKEELMQSGTVYAILSSMERIESLIKGFVIFVGAVQVLVGIPVVAYLVAKAAL